MRHLRIGIMAIFISALGFFSNPKDDAGNLRTRTKTKEKGCYKTNTRASPECWPQHASQSRKNYKLTILFSEKNWITKQGE